jgi:hypothetical protein
MVKSEQFNNDYGGIIEDLMNHSSLVDAITIDNDSNYHGVMFFRSSRNSCVRQIKSELM